MMKFATIKTIKCRIDLCGLIFFFKKWCREYPAIIAAVVKNNMRTFFRNKMVCAKGNCENNKVDVFVEYSY